MVYDFNNPKEVGSNDEKKYFLNLKNQQYIQKHNETLFLKLYKIIEEEKIYQEICIQIIDELLKSKTELIQDIVHDTSIDYVLKMTSIQYSTEILKLLAYYWDIQSKPDDFIKYKKILADKSPFCEIILNLKEGTKHTFEELFVRYLANMKRIYKGYPNLHQIILQKDRKYLINHEQFSIMYRAFANKYFIINYIPDNKKLLNLYDDFIFTTLSTKQQCIQNQIRNVSKDSKELEEILKQLDYQEIILILFARSQNQDNLLEQMLRNPKSIVNELLQNVCNTYEMETFYTDKMLLMVIIKIYSALNHNYNC